MPAGDQRGGAEALLLHFLRGNFEANGRDYVIVFLSDGGLVTVAREIGYDVRLVPTGRVRNPVQAVRAVGALRRIFRDEGVGVVFSWMSKAHLYAGIAAWIEKIPAMWYQHQIPDKHWLHAAVSAIPAARVICCSRVSEAAQRRSVFRRETSVVYPAVDLETIRRMAGDREPARAGLGLAAGGQVILMLARLERWKGVDVFIGAAEVVLAKRRDVTFVLVGGVHQFDPGYAAEVEERRSASVFRDRILFAGQRPLGEIPRWLYAADIVAHPVIGPEPFGMAIVEAMAAGRPVVASALGGPKEIIENGETGVLIEPGDAGVLARALEKLLDDDAVCERLGGAAAERAADFSVANLVTAINANLNLCTWEGANGG